VNESCLERQCISGVFLDIENGVEGAIRSKDANSLRARTVHEEAGRKNSLGR
jgi:hypothetical protein